jgi:hypothetical protein
VEDFRIGAYWSRCFGIDGDGAPTIQSPSETTLEPKPAYLSWIDLPCLMFKTVAVPFYLSPREAMDETLGAYRTADVLDDPLAT